MLPPRYRAPAPVAASEAVADLRAPKVQVPDVRLLPRATSAPPAVTEEVVPIGLAGYSADAWVFAASPKRLEILRRQLAAVRSEVAAAENKLQEDRSACAMLARQTEANRSRVRELKEDEARATAGETAENASISWDLTTIDNSTTFDGPGLLREALEQDRLAEEQRLHVTKAKAEMEAMQQETEQLALDVSAQAEKQIQRCHALRQMRAEVKLGRMRRGARIAIEARGRLHEECRARADDLQQASEAVASLRRQGHELKQEAVAAEAKAAVATADGLSRVVPEELAAALTSELQAEEQRTSLWRRIDATQAEAQEVLRRRSSELAEHLKEVQAGASKIAEDLQYAECKEAERIKELTDLRRAAAGLTEEVRWVSASQSSLEAELQQQRDATQAWRSCAQDLASRQQNLCSQAASAAKASRRLRGARDVAEMMTWQTPATAKDRAEMLTWQTAASAHDRAEMLTWQTEATAHDRAETLTWQTAAFGQHEPLAETSHGSLPAALASRATWPHESLTETSRGSLPASLASRVTFPREPLANTSRSSPPASLASKPTWQHESLAETSRGSLPASLASKPTWQRESLVETSGGSLPPSLANRAFACAAAAARAAAEVNWEYADTPRSDSDRSAASFYAPLPLPTLSYTAL